MKNRIVSLILIAFFLLEGTLIHWLLPSAWQTKLMLAPHLTFVVILLVSLLRNRHLGAAFGLVFGLMHDIVYATPMIGAHAFSMAMVAYIAGVAASRIKLNIAMTFFIIALCLVFYDYTVFSIYQLFRVTILSYSTMATQHLMPTLLFNLLFAVLIYVPARRWLEPRAEKREDEG